MADKAMQRVYQAPPDDDLYGVEQKEGMRYVRVFEHPPALGLGSEEARYAAMGYKVAKRVEGANLTIMMIEDETYKKRKDAAQQRARAAREAIKKQVAQGGQDGATATMTDFNG